MDTVDLDDVEIDLLRSPQNFEDMLLRSELRMMVIINAQVTYHELRCGSNSIIITNVGSL